MISYEFVFQNPLIFGAFTMMYMRSSEPHVPLHGCHIFKEFSRLEIFNELVLRPSEFQK